MKKKLKLSKLTVSNLNNTHGGKPIGLCYCDVLITNGVQNRQNQTLATFCAPPCESVVYCYTVPETCTIYYTEICTPKC